MKYKFSKLLRDSLDASGMTQKKAAEALHISAQTLSSYLNGRSTPDIELFNTIVKMFGIDVNKVFDTPDYEVITDLDIVNTIATLDQNQKTLIRAVLLYFHMVNKKNK